MSLSTDQVDIFRFLLNRRMLSLNAYGEEFQIPFTFSPLSLGEFHASIIVASLGPARGPLPELEAPPSVRWIYPVIGTSLETATSEALVLKCRAQQTLEQVLKVTLVGETEAFAASDYAVRLEIPRGYEFVRSMLDLQPTELIRAETTAELTMRAMLTPQRPFQQNVSLIVRNPLAQEWHFQVELFVELGKPSGTIVIESLLNKTGIGKVQLPVGSRTQMPFHAYFAAGSACEFSLSAAHGMLEPSLAASPELPIDVVFAPKMYGKLLKALLVVDALESQFLFDVVGKTPEYVPPVVLRGAFSTGLLGKAVKGRKSDLK
jgi:hypothetical protein